MNIICSQGRTEHPEGTSPSSLGSHICANTELPRTLLPCTPLGLPSLGDSEICTHVHTQPSYTYVPRHNHMSAHVFRDYTCTHASMYRYTCINPQIHTQDAQAHTATHTLTAACTHVHPFYSTWHTDRSRACLLPVWEWMFLWVHFDGCPEALRPGSACINQYLLLLIIKNKATQCLEHTSLGFLSAPWALT